MRYSGLGAQMGVLIGLGVWGGMKLDESQGNEKPIWALVGSLTGIFAGLYFVFKSLLSNK